MAAKRGAAFWCTASHGTVNQVSSPRGLAVTSPPRLAAVFRFGRAVAPGSAGPHVLSLGAQVPTFCGPSPPASSSTHLEAGAGENADFRRPLTRSWLG